MSAASSDSDDPSEYDALMTRLSISAASSKEITNHILKLVMSKETDILGELHQMWASVMASARQSPQTHSQLIDVLVRLADQPDVVDKDGKTVKVYEMVVWRDLPMFGWEINDEWNSFVVPKDDFLGESDTVRFWQNINRFTAALLNTSMPVLHFWVECLWTFRAVLEDDMTSPKDIRELEAGIPAAAIWIEITGDKIYKSQEDFPPAQGASPGMGGRLWGGKHGFCRERWNLWRTQFQKIATRDDLSEKTKTVAKDIAAKMESIEESSC